MQAHEDTRKMSRIFSLISWLLALGLLSWFFEEQLTEQLNPNVKLQSQHGIHGEIITTLKRSKSGHYVGTAIFNGQPATFLLDTGATTVSVSMTTATRLGLVKGQAVQVQTANGLTTAYESQLQSIQLGSILLTNIRASISPNLSGPEILLGMSALKQLEFNQQGDELRLIQRN